MIGNGKPTRTKQDCRYGINCTTHVHFDPKKRKDHNDRFNHPGDHVSTNKPKGTSPAAEKTLLSPLTGEEKHTYDEILHAKELDISTIDFFREDAQFTLQYCRFLMYVTRYVCEKVQQAGRGESVQQADAQFLKLIKHKMGQLDSNGYSASLHPTLQMNKTNTLTPEALHAYKSSHAKIFENLFVKDVKPDKVFQPLRDLLYSKTRLLDISSLIDKPTANPGISPGTVRRLIDDNFTHLGDAYEGGSVQQKQVVLPAIALLGTILISAFIH